MIKVQDILKNHFKELIIGILIALTYIPTFIWMWDRWFARDSYYSHGIMIPFISAGLIWMQRKKIQEIVIKGNNQGLWFIGLGLLIHLASSAFRIYFSSGFSLLLVIGGSIVYFYGWKMFQKVWFPFIFLVFMIPVPLFVITNTSFTLKILAAELATTALNDMGITAVRDGSLIKMRETYVVVDDVCSGLRSLISLTALGSLCAYLLKGHWIKKILLFLFTIPIAILTNAVRVIFLAFVSEVWGSEAASGVVHDLSGLVVFALALVLLLIAGKIIE